MRVSAHVRSGPPVAVGGSSGEIDPAPPPGVPSLSLVIPAKAGIQKWAVAR